MFDRRKEPRIGSDLRILLWGVDVEGMRFAQIARARNISQGGALLTGIDYGLRPGDLLGIQHGKKRARFRVVWSRPSGTEEKILAAVQKMEPETCPWLEELNAVGTRALAQPAPGLAAEPSSVPDAGSVL